MISFIRLYETKAPQRANPTDAGVDFYIPEPSAEFISRFHEVNEVRLHNALDLIPAEITGNVIRVPSGSSVIIPTGIKVCIHQEDTALIAKEKSGLATKNGVEIHSGVIDSHYSGEICVLVTNGSDKWLELECGTKMVQFLHVPIILDEYREVDEDEYNLLVSGFDRGEKGFGSSGVS